MIIIYYICHLTFFFFKLVRVKNNNAFFSESVKATNDSVGMDHINQLLKKGFKFCNHFYFN